MILDEPTAAIDPIEETRVYERFAVLARGKTAVIVTHRLGSVRLADRILVLREGRIAECGTHESLIKAGGIYAQMYAAQAAWYEYPLGYRLIRAAGYPLIDMCIQTFRNKEAIFFRMVFIRMRQIRKYMSLYNMLKLKKMTFYNRQITALMVYLFPWR